MYRRLADHLRASVVRAISELLLSPITHVLYLVSIETARVQLVA
jgi:hypothetical protein